MTSSTIWRSVVAVPARLASTRLPDKVLAEIGGQTMIERVLNRCASAEGPSTVVLCTDSDRLRDLASGWGYPVLMTAESCSSGSERIASVADQLVALAWGEQPDAWTAAQRQQRPASQGYKFGHRSPPLAMKHACLDRDVYD